ncbi:MAG: TIGR02270 family protein [Gammaproteobacteria bacterium]|nr:TIGR02270 family protein [Gammaproteobacteria bacterium]
MKILEKLTAKLTTVPDTVYAHIYEQYLTDASFLWVLRTIGVNQPHYTQDDIVDLEQRIETNLDGLMTSLELSWDVCLEALDVGQAGEVFTVAVVAFRSRDMEKIKVAVSAGLANDESTKGLISALAWLPDKLVHSWIQKFLHSKQLEHKYLAVAACSTRRENPGEILISMLKREDCVADKKLYARILRLIGELKLFDLRWALDEAYDDDDPAVKFWVNWSTLMLGDKSAVSQIKPFVDASGQLQAMAVKTAFRVLPVEIGRDWISQLAADPEQGRTVIEATGVLGDPVAVPWLIEKMRKVDTARLAAEAFSMITGIDLERYKLVIEAPEDITIIPNDNPDDESVNMDADENLVFPDVDKVAYTWQKHGSNYASGQRYFMGAVIDPILLQEKLTKGLQRQRHAAALELALLNPQMPLTNTKARSKAE